MTGHVFLGPREHDALAAEMEEQGMGGSIVFNATKNVTSPGRDFGAYSAAKAAEAQLARILAIEGVERTETSLVMGEVIGYRVGPLMQLAREEI